MSAEIKHIGVKRRSGRYPWGSGENPEQRNKSFLGQVEELKKKGMTQKQIADGLGMTTTQLRARVSIASAEERKANIAQAVRLKDKGYSNVAIAERMATNESTIRSWLDPSLKERADSITTISNLLKDNVDKKEYIDIGVGVERYIGVSRTKLQTSVAMLKEEGYVVTYVPVEQLGTGKNTNLMVLSKPKNPEAVEVFKLKNNDYDDDEISETLNIPKDKVVSLTKETYSEVFQNKDKIKSINGYTEDGGKTFKEVKPVRSVGSKRVLIRYGDEGGSDKDGTIELRRGVEDISLGNRKYAQVRIGVNDTHYMKGMALYGTNFPPGIDMIYNTNKPKDTPKEKVFKEMKNDPENPFGATVRQKTYKDKQGNEQQSALNIVNEEGEWRDKWSTSLSSQMLSKQPPSLAKKQLGLGYDLKKEEFDDIIALTNPAIKKRLLDSFADDCDSSAVHLKSAALPRTNWHVILPFPDMKDTEIYAPNYRDGEEVVLIRYPHGGRFEIPQLKVNNKHANANKVLKQAKDAVGISPRVAERLSGADFDGDTVLVIPNPKGVIKTAEPLKGLVDFNSKTRYPAYHGMKTIDGGVYDEKTGKPDFGGKKPVTRTKQMKMGDVSNLITDMTIKGANPDEIAAAVRHSMVVIDSEKHHLNYKQSYIDNNIASLKKKYQGSERSGASTLISRASSDKRVDDREDGIRMIDPATGKEKKFYVDPKTGKKLYTYTGETYTNKEGEVIKRTVKSTKMAEADDAFTLSSGTPIETVYATHANKLKSLANEARKESLNIKGIQYSASAKKTYAAEVAKLNADLNLALKNAPLERQAQILANAALAAKKADNPHMDGDELKKIKSQELIKARNRTGAKKHRIEITERQWEAIQAGAISNNTLSKILMNTDLDRIKELATPRATNTLSPAKTNRAKMYLANGYTQSEVADMLGVSTQAVSNLIN